MKLFDCCLNLTHNSFNQDRAELLTRAHDMGVDYALVCGADLDDSAKCIALARSHSRSHSSEEGVQLFATAGVHPHHASEWNDDSAEMLISICKENKGIVSAVGEAGMDYARNYSTPQQQKLAFSQQLQVAAQLKLPVFLHQREAHDDFHQILKDYADKLPTMLVHCFTGQKDELLAYVELGCYIGITGWFCDERRGEHLGELISLIPAERLIVETDSPYLIPRTLKAKLKAQNKVNLKHKLNRNEPAYLPHLVEALAKQLGQKTEELAQQTLLNAFSFLQLPLMSIDNSIDNSIDE